MKNVGRSALSMFAIGAFALTGATAASANTNGQYGYTGRTQSCLACHGSQQYDGLAVTVAGTGDPTPCWVVDEEQSTAEEQVLKLLSLPTLQFNQTVDVTISIDAPGNAVSCPTEDCCDCEGADCAGKEICGNADGFYIDGNFQEQGTCINFLTVCDADNDGTDDPLAGFNIEVVGGGAFAKANANDDSIRFLENGGEVIPTEMTHAEPAYFNGDTVTWNLQYTAPAEADYEDAVQFWVGANVANGNGKADAKDLNSNYQVTLALGDRLPSYCAVCEDGSPPDDTTGTCGGGCSHTGLPENTAPLGAVALGLVGMLFFRRRRR